MQHSHRDPRLALPKLTPSEEEYLEAIYMLSREVDGAIKIKQLAKHLGVKAPSIVEMVRKLSEKQLVIYDRSGVKLTEPGRERAIKIVRRHQLAERLLSDVLKHELPGLHEHACEFEHILDDELAERIEHTLGKPATCPHGNPIPSSDGKLLKLEAEPLVKLSRGMECIVMTIPEERELVGKLAPLNLLPGTKIRVLEKLPLGALLIQVGKTQIALSRNIASKIMVSPTITH